MSANVEQSPAVAATSAASSGTKVSFAVKKGFVIPKNKLSGSLVPTFRGGKKGLASDAVDEESNKQVQRKTKWGPDLTQDVSVKKVRALAYQTRVDQITEQLKSGFLDTEDNQDSSVEAQNPNLESVFHQKSELLELERREAIGEILKLNPSYKPPSDYKPLLKEAKVPVPTKEHPGYNFLGILFGPSSDNLKRLEKETGAKVRVYGTKANTREKAEITSSDANEAHVTYDELYVHIYADNYEKVDAAIALIEPLVKPVLVNKTSVSTMPTPVSADDVKLADQTGGTSAPNTVPPIGVNPEFQQPISASAPIPPPQFSYSAPWFSPVPPQPPNNVSNTASFFDSRPVFDPRPVPQRPFMPQGQFGLSPSHPQPSSTGFSPGPSMGPLRGPRGPQPISQQPVPTGPNAFTSMPPRMSSFTPNQSGPQMQRAMVHPATPNPPPIAPPFPATSAPQPPLFQSRTPNSFVGINAPPIQSQRPPNDNFIFQPQRPPNDNNFTFQPQRPQNIPSQANPRPIIQNMMNQNQPFRHNPSPQEILEAILRPLLNQNLNQIRNQFPPLPENSNFGPQGGPRNNIFPVQPNFRGTRMGPRDMGNPFPPRQGNSLHPQHNFPPPNRPQNFFAQNIRGRDMSTSIRPNIGHGAHQVYDPFSPSDVSDVPPRGG